MKKLAIITTTRAEYGLLYPVIKKFREKEDGNFELELIVTGTHLSKDYGMTISEIEQNQIRIDEKIKVSVNSENPISISTNMAEVLVKFTNLFQEKKYDAIMILGDRYEMLSIAIAAMNTMTPIFHLCGGDTTEGAIDECIRHSITKMSYLHFVTNETSRKRVIQLGEDPSRVFNVGSTSVDNILGLELYSKEDALKSIGLNSCNYALCTYHPVTLDNMSIENQMIDFIEVIKKFPEIEFIVTKSNSDLGGSRINAILDENEGKIENLHVYTSLGIKRYLSLMKSCEFVLGNSSSGIIEAPILKVPTVNIGDRQKGRLQCDSIINCSAERNSISLAIRKALTDKMKKICKTMINPYGYGNTSEQIMMTTLNLLNSDINLKKRFYDIEEEII